MSTAKVKDLQDGQTFEYQGKKYTRKRLLRDSDVLKEGLAIECVREDGLVVPFSSEATAFVETN